MRKRLLLATLFTALAVNAADASEEDLRKELELLKKRIEVLEKKLSEKNEKETKVAREVEEIKKKLDAFEIHGNAVTYYQGASVDEIDGEHYSNPSGAGYIANLEISFKPYKDGEFYMRLHAGEGDGADGNGVADALFANLNTLADDNPGSDRFRFIEAYYRQALFDGKLELVIGKTEPFIIIDDNEYANDEIGQFVGKPFVNNAILDPEDQFAPMVGVIFSPFEKLAFKAVFQSNEQSSLYWNADSNQWEVKDKDLYSNIFDKPFLAFQVTYSPKINGLDGNYRIYYWNDSADHVKVGEKVDNPVKRPSTEDGYGVGISFDQKIFENVGIFGRAAWANDVYEVEQFYSLGASIEGLIPSRKNDIFAFGAAALIPNDKLENDDIEWHFETYYKIQLSENLSVTPDFQYVVNPHGDTGNDDIFTGMLKAEFSF